MSTMKMNRSIAKLMYPEAFDYCGATSDNATIEITDDTGEIEELAFFDAHNITTVFIPPTVNKIGKGAFWNCSRLQTVIMPYKCLEQLEAGLSELFNVRKINHFYTYIYLGKPFQDHDTDIHSAIVYKASAPNLREVSTKTIFYKGGLCDTIQNIKIWYSPSFMREHIENVATKFSNAESHLLNGMTETTQDNLTDMLKCVEICNGVQFSDCTLDDMHLTKIWNISNGIYEVPPGYFSNQHLILVSFSSSVRLGHRAFYNCQDLRYVHDNTISLGYQCFSGCISLERFSVTCRKIPYGCFENCISLKECYIHYNNNYDCYTTISHPGIIIESHAFANCINLEKINLTNNDVEYIDPDSFIGCINLRKLTPDYIEEVDLYGQTNEYGKKLIMYAPGQDKENVTINRAVKEIAPYAFAHATKIKLIKLPNTIKYLEGAFYGCINLQAIIIPNSVTEIRDYTFSQCKSLRSITIPSSVTRIDEYVFPEPWINNRFTVYVTPKTYAEQYCIEHNIIFKHSVL